MTETTNNHHEEWLEYPQTRVGITREEALQRLRDEDLWLLDPEARYVAGVEEWEEAGQIIEDLASAGALLAASPAARCILNDAVERCEALAERARQRTA